MSFLKVKVSFPSNFASVFSTIKITLLYFFRTNIIYFDQRQPIKVHSFEIFEYLNQNLSNYSWQFWTEKSIPLQFFASFFILKTHNSLLNFKLKYFQLWTKESHQSPHFQIYRCSDENLPTSLCYFPTQKLVFLQILHHSKITKKHQSKCKFLGLLSVWIKTHQILIIFETTNQFSFNFFINLEWHQT